MLNFDFQLFPRKPEEQHAGVGKALVEDQLAEIAVGNQQNPLFLLGDRQNILIWKTMRVVSRDSRHVVAEVLKVVDETKICALIKQEFHTSGAPVRAPFGGFGETSSPVTIALA
jgi:hypothetical protein